jgi:hypothetical protein
MHFQEQIQALAQDVSKRVDQIKTEEATKQFLIIPFIQALGYDVFNPSEVVPEFTADVGTKQGEKVDYAILRDGEPIMLFECKAVKEDLSTKQMSQLYRYFSVTPAKIGVLTNGVKYYFFTDLDEPNKMDNKPFPEFDFQDITDPRSINELKRFSRSGFDIEELVPAAVNLKYTKEIKRIFDEQLSNPSRGFVKFFASQVYSGNKTSQVMDMFTGITKNALNQYISDRVTERLEKAIEQETGTGLPPEPQPPEPRPDPSHGGEGGITPQEREAYFMVKGIIAGLVDPKRILFRDYKEGCRVMLDNDRKPVCHIVANEKEARFVLFDENKSEDEKELAQLNDIYKYLDQLKKIVTHYESAESEES